MQRLVILGSTGSLGDQTLDIVQRYPEHFQVVGVAAKHNAEKLVEQAEHFGAERLFLESAVAEDHRRVEKREDLIHDAIDHLMVLDHGLESFQAVLKAITLKKKVSIANKELIIAHGADIMYFAREQQVEVIPIDSEHNALYQCLKGEKASEVRRLIITASGGPFRGQQWHQLEDVSPEQVLKHPNWSMGAKTTVDSATLVNKAYEVIETHLLFGIPYDRIEVRLHPESIVHAMVEFTDGNVKMLAYKPDMRFSLGYALFAPERAPECLTGSEGDRFDLDHDLHFQRLEQGQYPCFDFVMATAHHQPQSLRQLVMNDERAVKAFMAGSIAFTDILQQLQHGLL